MTLEELWRAIEAGGTGFVLFLGVALFFSGRLVNGQVARQARLDEREALVKHHTEQMELMQKRYDEMQQAWKERCEEVGKERTYYRSIALQFARQAEQGLQLASDKLPNL